MCAHSGHDFATIPLVYAYPYHAPVVWRMHCMLIPKVLLLHVLCPLDRVWSLSWMIIYMWNNSNITTICIYIYIYNYYTYNSVCRFSGLIKANEKHVVRKALRTMECFHCQANGKVCIINPWGLKRKERRNRGSCIMYTPLILAFFIETLKRG